MKPKITGCCSKCDAEVFEVLERNPETRLPTRLGKPLDNAVRATFLLADGTRMDLTFCQECHEGLLPGEYPWLWRRVMTSWTAEAGPDHPWPKTQVNNAILARYYSKPWKEVM